jgi:hypothetical protein
VAHQERVDSATVDIPVLEVGMSFGRADSTESAASESDNEEQCEALGDSEALVFKDRNDVVSEADESDEVDEDQPKGMGGRAGGCS